MKKLFSLIFIASAITAVSQPKKAPKMAPVTTTGYYLGNKNDTVRGEVQTNPDEVTDFYHKFGFRPGNKPGAKVAIIDTKKTKGYGFDNRHFTRIPYDGEDVFVEILASGRLVLFEFKHTGKNDQGYEDILSDYFIQDTRAEGESVKLKEIAKFSGKFYKKALQPYFKDQPMIWSDLDKFKLDKNAIVNAVNEFNKFYIVSAD